MFRSARNVARPPTSPAKELGRPPCGAQFQHDRFQSWNGLTWDMAQPRHIPISLINHCGPVAMLNRQGSPWRNLTPLHHSIPPGPRARFAGARFAVALFAKLAPYPTPLHSARRKRWIPAETWPTPEKIPGRSGNPPKNFVLSAPSQAWVPFCDLFSLRPSRPGQSYVHPQGNWGEDAFHYCGNSNVCAGPATNPPHSANYPVEGTPV